MTASVYALISGERIVYIGSSKWPKLRAGVMKRRGRKFDRLAILSEHEDRYDAFREEHDLINRHQPKWNIRGKSRIIKHVRRQPNAFQEATDAFQRSHIQAACEALDYDMLATAQALGISLAALYAKCKRLGIALAGDKAKRKTGK